MITHNSILIDRAVHDLINLHLYPEVGLRLGQSDRCRFKDADVTWERTGSQHDFGWNAVTYAYTIAGEGFFLHLLATWIDEDQATARVRVTGLHPDDAAALEAWLNRAVTGRRSPRDTFAQLGLS